MNVMGSSFTVQCYAERGDATVCPSYWSMFFTQVGILWK